MVTPPLESTHLLIRQRFVCDAYHVSLSMPWRWWHRGWGLRGLRNRTRASGRIMDGREELQTKPSSRTSGLPELVVNQALAVATLAVRSSRPWRRREGDHSQIVFEEGQEVRLRITLRVQGQYFAVSNENQHRCYGRCEWMQKRVQILRLQNPRTSSWGPVSRVAVFARPRGPLPRRSRLRTGYHLARY
jgi:hypothetical protein